MDQNQQFQNDGVFCTPPVKNAAYFRQRAREALKPCFGSAILVSLLASLLGGGAGGFSFSYDSSSVSTEKVNQVVEQVRSEGVMSLFEAYPSLIALAAIFVFALVGGVLVSLFVSAPVTLGYQRYNLNVIDGKGNDNPMGALFSYFKKAYKKSIGLYALYSLLSFLTMIPMMLGCGFVVYAALRVDSQPEHTAYLAFLGMAMIVFLVTSAVSIVLAILVQYRYYFCFMILAEYPEMRVIDALRNSATLMKGNKWRLFCLHWSFFGWILLSVFTCGIGMIFLMPYMSAADAAFYDDIANRTAAKEAEFPSLNPDDYRVDEQDWWTQQ